MSLLRKNYLWLSTLLQIRITELTMAVSVCLLTGLQICEGNVGVMQLVNDGLLVNQGRHRTILILIVCLSLVLPKYVYKRWIFEASHLVL